ncbi:MAG: hypothetical protein QM776_07550 [Rhodocyclaceae bacterium]
MHTPAIIDIEASGFGKGSYPIEVGFVLPDGRSECMLIQPAERWTHWDSRAETVHGITRDTLLMHGKPIVDVATALNRALRGLTVYSDAWSHDYTWLSVLYDEAEMVPSFRLEHLVTLMTEHDADQWNATRAIVEREMQLNRHRASSDARVLQGTWLRLNRQQAA